MPNPNAFLGLPQNFKNKFKVYPASIKEVVGNEYFPMYRSIFSTSADDIQDAIKKSGGNTQEKIPSPFEYLLINCYYDQQFYEYARSAFEFFTHKKMWIWFEKKIVVIEENEPEDKSSLSIENLILLTEDEYFDFQNAIRASLGEKTIAPPEPIDPDENPMIAEIKARGRERDRLKARRAAKDGISLDVILTAICCMGIGITPLNIGEMSYAAIGPIMNMMQEKEKYDIDIRSLLAGADSKKIKPKYWIRNTDKE